MPPSQHHGLPANGLVLIHALTRSGRLDAQLVGDEIVKVCHAATHAPMTAAVGLLRLLMQGEMWCESSTAAATVTGALRNVAAAIIRVGEATPTLQTLVRALMWDPDAPVDRSVANVMRLPHAVAHLLANLSEQTNLATIGGNDTVATHYDALHDVFEGAVTDIFHAVLSWLEQLVIDAGDMDVPSLKANASLLWARELLNFALWLVCYDCRNVRAMDSADAHQERQRSLSHWATLLVNMAEGLTTGLDGGLFASTRGLNAHALVDDAKYARWRKCPCVYPLLQLLAVGGDVFVSERPCQNFEAPPAPQHRRSSTTDQRSHGAVTSDRDMRTVVLQKFACIPDRWLPCVDMKATVYAADAFWEVQLPAAFIGEKFDADCDQDSTGNEDGAASAVPTRTQRSSCLCDAAFTAVVRWALRLDIGEQERPDLNSRRRRQAMSGPLVSLMCVFEHLSESQQVYVCRMSEHVRETHINDVGIAVIDAIIRILQDANRPINVATTLAVDLLAVFDLVWNQETPFDIEASASVGKRLGAALLDLERESQPSWTADELQHRRAVAHVLLGITNVLLRRATTFTAVNDAPMGKWVESVCSIQLRALNICGSSFDLLRSPLPPAREELEDQLAILPVAARVITIMSAQRGSSPRATVFDGIVEDDADLREKINYRNPFAAPLALLHVAWRTHRSKWALMVAGFAHFALQAEGHELLLWLLVNLVVAQSVNSSPDVSSKILGTAAGVFVQQDSPLGHYFQDCFENFDYIMHMALVAGQVHHAGVSRLARSVLCIFACGGKFFQKHHRTCHNLVGEAAKQLRARDFHAFIASGTCGWERELHMSQGLLLRAVQAIAVATADELFDYVRGIEEVRTELMIVRPPRILQEQSDDSNGRIHVGAAASRRYCLMHDWGPIMAPLTTRSVTATPAHELDPHLGFELDRRKLRRRFHVDALLPSTTATGTGISSELCVAQRVDTEFDDVRAIESSGLCGIVRGLPLRPSLSDLPAELLCQSSCVRKDNSATFPVLLRVDSDPAAAGITIAHPHVDDGLRDDRRALCEKHALLAVPIADRPPSRRSSAQGITPRETPRSRVRFSLRSSSPSSVQRSSFGFTPQSPGLQCSPGVRVAANDGAHFPPEVPWNGVFIAAQDIIAVLPRGSPDKDATAFEIFSTTHDPILVSFSYPSAPKPLVATEKFFDFVNRRSWVKFNASRVEFKLKVNSLAADAVNKAETAIVPWVNAWRAGNVSTFKFLMVANFMAGRSYSDLNAYPVLPVVVKDFSSVSQVVPRDFSKVPLWKDTPDCERYTNDATQFGYSRKAYLQGRLVASMLQTVEPVVRATQDEVSQDNRNRANFPNLAVDLFRKLAVDRNELIPEFFTLPAMLPLNCALPEWANGIPGVFMFQHRLQLEQLSPDNVLSWFEIMFGSASRNQTDPSLRFDPQLYLDNFGRPPFEHDSDKPPPRPLTRSERNHNGTVGWQLNRQPLLASGVELGRGFFKIEHRFARRETLRGSFGFSTRTPSMFDVPDAHVDDQDVKVNRADAVSHIIAVADEKDRRPNTPRRVVLRALRITQHGGLQGLIWASSPADPPTRVHIMSSQYAGRAQCCALLRAWWFSGHLSGVIVAGRVSDVIDEKSSGSAHFTLLLGHLSPVTNLEASQNWHMLVSLDSTLEIRTWDTKTMLPAHKIVLDAVPRHVRQDRFRPVLAVDDVSGNILVGSVKLPSEQAILAVYTVNLEPLVTPVQWPFLPTACVFDGDVLLLGESDIESAKVHQFCLQPAATPPFASPTVANLTTGGRVHRLSVSADRRRVAVVVEPEVSQTREGVAERMLTEIFQSQ